MLKALCYRSFLYNLFSLARFSHAKKYLLKGRVNPYETFVLAKNKKRSYNIWSLKQVKWRLSHVEDDLYTWKLGNEVWLANLDQVHGLYEYLTGAFAPLYGTDFQNKRILDVGGYIGDTARYFLRHGASHVTIYEPVSKNLRSMRENLKEFVDQIEIHSEAIAEKDGPLMLSSRYPEGHIGFGCEGNHYSVHAKGISFVSVLSGQTFDMAKIDCEGNETYLLEVPDNFLQRVAHWIIEIHDLALYPKMHAKFLGAGFKMEMAESEPGHLGVVHYRSIEGV